MFSPSTAGNETGTLTITDDASNSPQTVALSGMGSNLQLSFGDQSQLARQAAVMRGHGVFSQAFGKMMAPCVLLGGGY